MSQSLTHSVSVTDDTEKSSADVNSANNANNGGNLTVPGNGNGVRISGFFIFYLIIKLIIKFPGHPDALHRVHRGQVRGPVVLLGRPLQLLGRGKHHRQRVQRGAI